MLTELMDLMLSEFPSRQTKYMGMHSVSVWCPYELGRKLSASEMALVARSTPGDEDPNWKNERLLIQE